MNLIVTFISNIQKTPQQNQECQAFIDHDTDADISRAWKLLEINIYDTISHNSHLSSLKQNIKSDSMY